MPLDGSLRAAGLGRIVRLPLLGKPPKTLTLASWGRAVRSEDRQVPDPYFGMVPLRLRDDGQLDLEFAPLLLAERILVDVLPFDVITRSRKPGLSRARASLTRLNDEGILKIVDFQDAAVPVKKNIVEITNRSIAEPRLFSAGLIRSNQLWDEISVPLSSTLGLSSDPVAMVSLGNAHALCADGQTFNTQNVEKMSKVLAKLRWTKSESHLVAEMLRPYFEHVLSHIAVAQHFHAPVIDWRDLEPLYQSALLGQLQPVPEMETHIPQVRELFSNVMSKFQPDSVEEFLKILRDPGVKHFRSFVVDCAEKRIEFNVGLAQALIRDLSRARARNGRLATKLSITFAVTGVMAGWIDPSLMIGIASAVWQSRLPDDEAALWDWLLTQGQRHHDRVAGLLRGLHRQAGTRSPRRPTRSSRGVRHGAVVAADRDGLSRARFENAYP